MHAVPAVQWDLDNLAWTDVNATSDLVTCQQENFGLLPFTFLQGDWIDYKGATSCPAPAAPAAAAARPSPAAAPAPAPSPEPAAEVRPGRRRVSLTWRGVLAEWGPISSLAGALQ